jgi:hypothetical protein
MVIARRAPLIFPPMIPFCSRFDSVLFTPKTPAIAGCFNFSRSPKYDSPGLGAFIARESIKLVRFAEPGATSSDIEGPTYPVRVTILGVMNMYIVSDELDSGSGTRASERSLVLTKSSHQISA